MTAVRQPSGTVTLVFTDIEGSTRLLQDLGTTAYRDALARHRELVRNACNGHQGYEVDYEGDAFFYAFQSAGQAVAAVNDAMASLADGPIRIRVGIHTGEPALDPPKYIGMDVHHAARIMSSAHGGQVVLSRESARMLGDDVQLLELGEHRLKDIAEPVPLFQLGGESFPPLKTISNTNLPRPASSFVGRVRELEAVLRRLDGGARLITLTGPGGTGKTRLALEVASSRVGEYKAGVFWIGLSAIRDPAVVTEAIAQTLGAKDGLAEHIGERQMLLLLDNLEQVIEAAPALSLLVNACPNLSLLVTSRELLRVQGEVEYAVPPLDEWEAIAVFCDRAQVEPSAEIEEICRRLDSLPLAVELAAARTKALTPAQILERLSQRLDLLKGGRDADPRQQTLRATIEWSHDLLSGEEQRVFSRLSVFVGGCTLDAAEEVAGADLDILQQLVEKSLLRFSNERYWMLETIREYATERLAESGDLEKLQLRHADFVLTLSSRLEAALGSDSELRDRFALEQDNFREVLTWAERTGRTGTQLDLISRSWQFWWYRGHAGEGLRWVESALASSVGEQSARTVEVRAAGAMFAVRLRDLDTLLRYAEESLAIARTLSDARHTIWPLIFLGIWASESGDLDRATRLYEQAIDVARAADDRKLVGNATNNLGVVSMLRGDYARAVPIFEEALRISRELGMFDEMALESLNLAFCLHETDRSREAAKITREGLELAAEIGSMTGLVYGFVLLAAVACRLGRADADAAKLLGVAEALRDRVGEEIGDEAEVLETTVTDLVGALGEDRYAAAIAEGKAMSLEHAVAYARRFMD
jgi:predicted ATPase/class 3 adenylate cyclase